MKCPLKSDEVLYAEIVAPSLLAFNKAYLALPEIEISRMAFDASRKVLESLHRATESLPEKKTYDEALKRFHAEVKCHRLGGKSPCQEVKATLTKDTQEEVGQKSERKRGCQ